MTRWLSISLLFLVACGQTPEAEVPGTLHNMKGFEVYHWEHDGEVRWAMLIGTNRLKAVEEIEAVAVASLNELEAQLHQLAPGETVNLVPPPVHPARRAPSPEAVERLKALCGERELELLR